MTHIIDSLVACSPTGRLDAYHIDCIFGANDRMAVGARQALEKYIQCHADITSINPASLLYLGVDALPMPGGGIEQVRDGRLTVSAIYPTHGDEEIVKVAEMFGLAPIRDINLATNDAEALLQPVDFEDQVRSLLSQHELQMVVLTCGAYGSYVVTEDGIHFEATPKVKVADTVGAGDSFTGSFCAAILAGKSIAEAHKIGVDVSAFVCTQAGAMPIYPEELIRRVRE